MAQSDDLCLDFGNVSNKNIDRLVFVKENLVSNRDTNDIGPGGCLHDLEEVGHLAGVGRIILVDPEADDDLEVELLALDRVEDILEDLAVGSVETDAAGGLDEEV